MPLPAQVPRLQAVSKPTDIEIGCGNGQHALQYCKNNPQRNLIAIERTKNKFTRFVNEMKTNKAITNLCAIRSDARNWIFHFVPPASIDRYFILYPNPHPLRKQLNQRWHNMPFMGHLKKTIKKGGTLTLATNITEYAEEAIKVMTDTWKFSLEKHAVLHKSKVKSLEPRTAFEKKYLERDERCHDLLFSNWC